jgi:hypothetical protein
MELGEAGGEMRGLEVDRVAGFTQQEMHDHEVSQHGEADPPNEGGRDHAAAPHLPQAAPPVLEIGENLVAQPILAGGTALPAKRAPGHVKVGLALRDTSPREIEEVVEHRAVGACGGDDVVRPCTRSRRPKTEECERWPRDLELGHLAPQTVADRGVGVGVEHPGFDPSQELPGEYGVEVLADFVQKTPLFSARSTIHCASVAAFGRIRTGGSPQPSPRMLIMRSDASVLLPPDSASASPRPGTHSLAPFWVSQLAAIMTVWKRGRA